MSNERKLGNLNHRNQRRHKKKKIDFLWFTLQQEHKSNCTGIYSPKVGPDDYNETFLMICLKLYSKHPNNTVKILEIC